ncbi:hypothetical protein DN730_06730 [Marinomonas piezotolerans]|uniref:Lipoprotein n=1 Tax=Marinomonas piezotolerans TaxID=2213058 RepID=A0A370UC26_9GAMM|nr:hypothetical protein [Marinomonas piezotolerans]RDL45299.1 hypothetical protein DN730_06730 [Marinomonas piezotolerans]
MKKTVIYLAITAAIAGCNSDSDSDTSASSTKDALNGIFPTGMMVTSPTQRVSASKLSDGASFKEASEAVEDAGEAAATFSSRFDPAYFFGDVVDAECFGPPVAYDNHPDGTDAADLTDRSFPALPSGDVGIWTAANGTTTEACAAAQLNSQMKGAASRVFMSMVSFAGMVATASANGISLPTAGNSISLTSELDARLPSSISVTTATLAKSATGVWSYTLVLEYTDPTPPTGATTPQTISLSMEHHPGTSNSAYEGVINYKMDDYFNPSGNCTADTHGGSSTTNNGSLHYKRNGDDINFQHRYAGLCGHDQDGLSESITGMTLKHVAPNSAWKNNFTILTSDFDKSDMSGSYAYTWQAGDNDSAARILFVGLNSNNNNGEAYYGYGDQVQNSTSGDILGFYCNWAGPGQTATRHDYAQRQFLTYDATDQRYELSSAASSNITYAPTNSCTYAAGSGFVYDKDIDVTNGIPDTDALTDESDVSVSIDLMDKTVGTTTYSTIMEAIAGRGYNKPTYPAP